MKRAIVLLVAIIATALVLGISSSTSKADPPCWDKTWGYTWGYWPLYQRLTIHTYWCASNGKMYYRSTTVVPYSPSCSWEPPYQYRIAGGMGQPYVEWVSGATFHCSIYGVGYNFNRSLTSWVNAWGQYAYGS